MGSFKANGREQGPDRRRKGQPSKKRGSFNLESLEDRTLLSDGSGWRPSNANLADAQNGPMANLGTQLVKLYQEFDSGKNIAALKQQFPLVQFQNSAVLVSLTADTDYDTFRATLGNLGMQITSASKTYGLVEGYLPIHALPTAAQLPQTMSGSAAIAPKTSRISINEAAFSTFSDVAAQQTGLTGAGVTVGVLSDSFNTLGGYATDVSTGDLPSNVNILDDSEAGEDEGRAMAQNIYYIAPGAGLAFATAFAGQAEFGQNILRLANEAGAKVIVDDVTYLTEAWFQPGIISQAVNQVTANGVSYFSSAANATNGGYLSNYRTSNATIPGIGTGQFMDFDPGTGVNNQLTFTTSSANSSVGFQFDQPYSTQQPTGASGRVTSQMNIFVLDSTGAVVASGIDNNVATQAPFQFVTIPAAGTYTIAIQLVSGSAPGHVQLRQWDGDIQFSQQYGNAGGTYYPTSTGHNSSATTIGVGATPWWSPAPFLNQTPLASEPFSSYGPAIQVFDVNGVPLSSARTIQNPAITAPDGGSTTFFGQVADTSNPPFPGQPATPTNLYATFTPDQSNLPSFFGTSSSAPNAAAIAALMLQRVPGATPAQVRDALIASATPMNGTAAGTWDPQAGFGNINAVRAINAVDVLRVVTTNPGNGTVVTVTPSAITVTFSKPVNFSTVQSSDLVFTSAPAGVTVNLGAPIAIDNPTTPTVVSFPFSFTYTNPPTTTANGSYTFEVRGPITSTDNKQLQPTGPITFTLNDTTAPRITNTSLLSREISVEFSKAMNPATINLSNVVLQRQGNTGNWDSPINVSVLPGAVITYDVATRTATLNLNALAQSALPSDTYRLFVRSGSTGVTDLVGNQLDGEYNSSFPSGDGTTGGNFLQNLGYRAVQAPIFTVFTMLPGSDTGIAGDQNTGISTPGFIGQVYSAFPGTVANIDIYVQFGGPIGGNFTLGVGPGNRGVTGSYDLHVKTDQNGRFIIQPNAPLPEGFQRVRIVAVGAQDIAGQNGLAASTDRAFRIDKTAPQITSASLTPGGAALPMPNGGSPNTTFLPSLSTLSLTVTDPVHPTTGALGTPEQVVFPAIAPTSAANVGNYTLTRINSDGSTTDASQFILTATFVAGTATITGGLVTAYNGQINLTFASGLPAGKYVFTAHTKELNFPGLLDAAGNSIDNTTVTGQGGKNFSLNFDLQPQPAYITNLQMQSVWNPSAVEGVNTIGGPRSYYELPSSDPSYVPRASAPPKAWIVDLSSPIAYRNYSSVPANQLPLQLIGSANAAGGTPDGEFGSLGTGGLGSTGSGFNIVQNVALQLYNYDPVTQTSTPVGPGGVGNRLVLTYTGSQLAADTYRLYMPNSVNGAIDTRLTDIFGNQFDGEFLGNPTASGAYEVLLPNGSYRSGLTGDTTPGGAFMTGFSVVPTGNIIFARPDYQEDPLNPDTMPDGSLAKPYSALAPESDPNTAPPNPTHDPNGGQNSSQFFLSGFNPNFDRNGNGRFDRSALYAASQLAFRGPVVVVALPGTPQRNPITGVVSQLPFVLQAPSGSDPVINNASASVPFNTLLSFTAGTTVKLQNASLFAQNQGSAIQTLGGSTSSSRVTFTSYSDDTIGGDTNGDGTNTVARGGDWGGVVFRNFDQSGRTTQFPVDGTLKGVNGGAAISGSDDALSSLNFMNLSYAGGAVPLTNGVRYDGVMMYNSRPAITNTQIAFVGGGSSAQAGISGDFNSYREDDLARGPLVRRTTITNSSINGIWVRPELTGQAQQTDAMAYVPNPGRLGGTQNFTFDDPLPYVLTSRLNVGQRLDLDTLGQGNTSIRLYVQVGMMVKLQRGASVAITSTSASFNVGDRTYINEFDLGTADPNLPGFRPNTQGDAQPLFTSFADDAASTFYFDPVTQQSTTIVPPIDSDNNGNANQPSPGNVPVLARWGAIDIRPGAQAVIDEAQIRYGGGFVNVPGGTLPSLNVLTLSGMTSGTGFGANVSITNNDFFDNQDAPLALTPDNLFAGNPLMPLASGNPFFRGNVMLRNDINGMAVIANPSFADGGPVELAFVPNADTSNLDVNSVWDDTDLAYVVRGTIILGGRDAFFDPRPMPDPEVFGPQLTPAITLTIQSNLPDTLLANGTRIARPGESVIVKFLNDPLNTAVRPPGDNVNGSTGDNSDVQAGAGFIVGVDDGVDPPAAPLLGAGMDSQIRIIGIGANETTGQQRVPAILTSLLDSSVQLRVRGIDQSQTYPKAIPRYAGTFVDTRTTPAAGDGGLIYFGGKSLTDYNLWDPRDGNLIDNTDVHYLTRIEIQGGGVNDVYNTNPGQGDGLNTTYDHSATGSSDNPRNQLLGNGLFTSFRQIGQARVPFTENTALNQYNSARAMTISNSNIGNMGGDTTGAGILSHPGPNGLGRNVGPAITGPDTPTGGIFRTPFAGEPVVLLAYGNTFANMPVGVRMNADTGNNDTQQNAQFLTLMNNTFYNVNVGLHTQAPNWNPAAPGNDFSNVQWLAMNNIFSNSSDAAIRPVGQQWGSQAQYNLFFGNNTNLDGSLIDVGFAGNNGAIEGDPKFRNAANGDFRLNPGSAAIDASRSEIGPILNGNSLQPISTQVFSSNGTGGTRLRINRLGFAAAVQSSNLVSLPGYELFNFQSQWVPALNGSAGASNGTAANEATFSYVPITGERDQGGYLRVDDPSVANVGFGSRPFFDIGAFEYRQLFPPHVVNVTATIRNEDGSISTIPYYTVGGITGSNVTPETVNFTFDNLIDPNTITGLTVLLQASGGDGIFGNGNNADDKYINLAGKLSFDNATRTLIVSLGSAGTVLPTDRYRFTLLGTGSNVLRDPQGNALDGENTVNGDPNGDQLPLPSGDGFPGGNFFNNFLINTTAPEVVSGSFQLAPASDTNIGGDGVTSNTQPSFIGQISEPNPVLVPVQGQTAIVDIGVAIVSGGTTTIYYADSPNIPQVLLPYLRQNAGTGVTDATGNFTVTVGVDGAGTGLVTNTDPLLNSPYNVGSSGRLVPLPGTVNGYYVARARAVDQSGNQSSPTDPNARVPFVVDAVSPTVNVTNPTNGGVITSPGAPLTFIVESNENLDLTHFTTAQVTLLRSAPNGSFTDPAATQIALNGSFDVTYLDAGTGGTGRERFRITTSVPLESGLYQLTILGSGSNGARDIAGNLIAGGDLVVTFAVYNPNVVNGVFVGGSSYVTDPTLPQGSRANPFPTIAAAMAAASVGDRLQILPGVYTENVVLQPFVSIASAAVSSSNNNFVPGNALETIIRAPQITTADANYTVTAVNLGSLVDPTTGLTFRSTISGLTISSPLVGDPALGSVNPSAAGILSINSSLLIENSYIINGGMGIWVQTSGEAPLAPTIRNNVISGNNYGVLLQDSGTAGGTLIINNTFTYNTFGVLAINNANTSSLQAYIGNNIFWQNHAANTTRNGAGIYSQTIDKLLVNSNLFSGNGPSDSSNNFAAVNIGNGFDPSKLGPTGADLLANLGNFTGFPAFVAPRDPRPGSDGEATFLRDANFGLTVNSAAINNANEGMATRTDILGNAETPLPTNRGFHFTGLGPRDIGAFEYLPVGTTSASAVGGAFRVVTTSFVPDGGTAANGSTLNVSPAPNSVIVSFSRAVDKATVDATDLVLSGSSISALSPVKATSVTWIDDHTARFNLSGSFNATGTVNLSIANGAIKGTNGTAMPSYADKVYLDTQTPAAPTPTPTPTPSPTPTPAPTPAPAPAPTPAPAPAPTPTAPRRRVPAPRVRQPRPTPVPPVRRPVQTPAPVRRPIQTLVPVRRPAPR